MNKYKDILVEIESCDASGMTISEIAEQVGWSTVHVEYALMLIYTNEDDCYDGIAVQANEVVEFQDLPF